MGSPTDELRARLGELGVECGLDASSTHRSLWWRVGGVSYSATEVAGKVKVTAYYLTPEQAIDATVGAGTCHAVIDKGYYKGINGVCEGLYCSKCKEPLSRRFKHCPWCGRKIKEEIE